jgi:hypothetical protein
VRFTTCMANWLRGKSLKESANERSRGCPNFDRDVPSVAKAAFGGKTLNGTDESVPFQSRVEFGPRLACSTWRAVPVMLKRETATE